MKKNVMPTVVLGAILVVVSFLLSVVNMVTGPIIEANRNAAANGALLEVLPEGSDFEELNAAELGLPDTVTGVYKETSGNGFVFRVTAAGYKPGMVVMVGVDAEGKITGSKCLETQDTFGKEPELDNTYNGQTMSDFTPNMISGATMTSGGYRDAVSIALQAFALASGGEIDPAITLEGLIPTLHTGFSSGGRLSAESMKGGSFFKGYKALNGSGYAFIYKNGDTALLALVNAMNVCKVYDVEGNDVTAENESVVAMALLEAGAPADFSAEANKMITSAFSDATEITPVPVHTFGNVVYAVSFVSGEQTYYAFYSQPLTYGDHVMQICTVIDENGAIVKQDVKAFLFGHGVEYLPIYNGGYGDISSDAFKTYEEQFGGLTGETLTDSVLVSGATLSSTAVKLATSDAFNAFDSIPKGGEQ